MRIIVDEKIIFILCYINVANNIMILFLHIIIFAQRFLFHNLNFLFILIYIFLKFKTLNLTSKLNLKYLTIFCT